MQYEDSMVLWLHRRKINDATIQQFGIECKDSIKIPIRDPNGNLLFFKHRRNPFLTETGPKYWYDVGGQAELFGANFIKDKKTVVICEGELDALVLWSHNIPAVSSTGGALTFNADRWLPLLANKEIYICFDNDKAGARGTVKVLSYLPASKIVLIPEIAQVKDITDYYERGGDFRALMQAAKHYPVYDAVLSDMQARRASWQSTLFHETFFEWFENQNVIKDAAPRHDTNNDVERAKQIPITSLLKVSKKWKAVCPFHNDSNPSLHVYPDNHAFCFVCHKRADAIDIYRELHNCSFKEAVEEMKKL